MLNYFNLTGAMHHKQIEFLKCYIARIIPHLMIYQQCKMHSSILVYTAAVHPLFLCTTLYLSIPTLRMYVLCIQYIPMGGRRVLEFLVLKQSISKKFYLLRWPTMYDFHDSTDSLKF